MRLREFIKTDIALFRRWLYLPHVAKWYHEPQDWLVEVEDVKGEFAWIKHYIVEEADKAIGFCQFYEYCKSGENWHGTMEVRGTYSIDYMIGEADYLMKGFGKQIVQELIKKIKDEDGAQYIIVSPELENEASCRTLISSGFVYNKDDEIYIMEL